MTTFMVAATLALAGCATFRNPVTPMPTTRVAVAPDSRCLIVLLPGVYSGPSQFEREGFGEIAREQGVVAEIVAADAHLGYYRERSVALRLHEDLIAPARARGTEEIWLVGTSLGGLGAFIHLREYPRDLSGVFAIAPFLGDEEVIDEIAAAGGPASWRPPESPDDDDVGRKLWSWIVDGGLGDARIPVHLAWGTRDDFDRANRMLSGMLPDDHVYTVDGGHDWEAWTELWRQFLKRTRPCGTSDDSR